MSFNKNDWNKWDAQIDSELFKSTEKCVGNGERNFAAIFGVGNIGLLSSACEA